MLAIDPGKHSPGFALFDEDSKELFACSHRFKDCIGQYKTIVCELPVIYPRSPVDPNKIITLAISAGQLVERAVIYADMETEVIWVKPREWKGNIKKTPKLQNYIIYKRVVKTLNAYENKELARAIKEAPDAAFDIVDAVGIGLVSLGRL